MKCREPRAVESLGREDGHRLISIADEHRPTRAKFRYAPFDADCAFIAEQDGLRRARPGRDI
jgi:hypothetical protein